MAFAKYFLTMVLCLSFISMYAQQEPNPFPVNAEEISLTSSKEPVKENERPVPVPDKKDDELDEKYAALKAGNHKKYTQLIRKNRDFCPSLESAILAEDNASCKQLTRDKNNTEAAVENYQDEQRTQRRVHPFIVETLIFAGGVVIGAASVLIFWNHR